MKNTKKFFGFSLVEMMVVLLIVAVVMAASAPMISKKMVKGGTESNPWMWLGNEGSMGYNIGNRDVAAIIGAATDGLASNHAKLYIKTDGTKKPHLILKNENLADLYLTYTSKGSFIASNDTDSLCANKVVVIGQGAKANNPSGNGAIAIGANANATTTTVKYANSQIAIGQDSKANVHLAIALGDSASSQNIAAIAIGSSSQATANHAVALGSSASSQYEAAIAIGSSSLASAQDAVAIGNGANATARTGTLASNNTQSAREMFFASFAPIAIGMNSTANAALAMALGKNAQATNSAAVAIGYNATASGANSMALGKNAQATNSTDVAIGYNATASGANSVALGNGATASNANSVALGNGATASNANSVALGNGATASDNNYIVLGTANHTVYIPGKLIVSGDATIAGNTALGVANGATVMMRARMKGGGSTGPLTVWYTPMYEGNPSLTLGSSDRRLKNVGKAFDGGLEQIKKLKVFNYTFKADKDKTPRVGVMAQDLQKIFPDAVIKGEDGFLMIRMEDIFYALVNAVKELDSRLTAVAEQVKVNIDVVSKLQEKVLIQEKQIEELKKQNADFEKRLVKLERK